MLSHFSAPWTATVSLLRRLSVCSRDWVVPGGWIVGLLLTSWLSASAWLTAAVGVVGMLVVVTRLVKMQDASRASLDQTEQARAALEQALRQAQKMAALGRLTVGVAHDFNNHLTVISSSVEMLAGYLDGARPLRHAEAALQGVRRAAALSGRLLSFSRQPEPEPEPLDVYRLLGGLSDLLRRTLPRAECAGLEVVLTGDPWLIFADAAQLESALLSLTVNVSDRVRDSTKLMVLVVNLYPNEAFAATYPGIPPADYLQITIGDSVAATQPGRWAPVDGVGSADLSMARAFVREASGYLRRLEPVTWPATNVFALRVLLPRYVPPALAVVAQASRDRRIILLVDHDAVARRFCAETLCNLGYIVWEASDAMVAIGMIADRGGVDLLLTDLELPGGVSGRDLADAVRSVDAGISILFGSDTERVGLPDRVAKALLRKPYHPAVLADRICEVLATKHRSELAADPLD